MIGDDGSGVPVRLHGSRTPHSIGFQSAGVLAGRGVALLLLFALNWGNLLS